MQLHGTSGAWSLAELCDAPFFEIHLPSDGDIEVPLDGAAGSVKVTLTGDVHHTYDLTLVLDVPRVSRVGTDWSKKPRTVDFELHDVQIKLHQDELIEQGTCGSDAFGHVGSKG